MQSTSTTPLVPRSGRISSVRSAVVAVVLLAAGVGMVWLLVGTPIVLSLVPSGSASPGATAAGLAAWAVAIVVPATLVVVGLTRLMRVLDASAAVRPRQPTPTLRHALSPGVMGAADVVLPGGRRIRSVLVGPFGAVILGEVPPPSVSRTDGMRWQVRGERGRWIPVEPPADRAARDAERLRGWLVADDRDFVITVRAILPTRDARAIATATCPIVDPRRLAGWLDSLPAQRSLVPQRLERLESMVAGAAAGRVIHG